MSSFWNKLIYFKGIFHHGCVLTSQLVHYVSLLLKQTSLSGILGFLICCPWSLLEAREVLMWMCLEAGSFAPRSSGSKLRLVPTNSIDLWVLGVNWGQRHGCKLDWDCDCDKIFNQNSQIFFFLMTSNQYKSHSAVEGYQHWHKPEFFFDLRMTGIACMLRCRNKP